MTRVANLKLKARVLKDIVGWGRTRPQDNQIHLKACIDWLQVAQDATPDAGVAQTWLVKHQRWANSYPETTGYIIPTLYRYAQATGDSQARQRARRMADWECEIQLSSGGVLAGALGDSDQPTVFNTGQVLFGWVRAAEVENQERYRTSAMQAANWLCDIQDEDGCWRQYGSPMTAKQINTYNTRTAWALARAFELTGEQRYLARAVKNCEWALTQQHANGWLEQNCLQDESQPFVHTIAYAMRGFLEVGVVAQRGDLIDAARTIGDSVLDRLPKNGKLPGRFDAHWQPTVNWSCLTGNVQMAVNWGRLFQLTQEARYREGLTRINRFMKTVHPLSGSIEERGGVKGSHPINGGYHPWQFPNWAVKYFADALMIEDVLHYGGDRANGFYG